MRYSPAAGVPVATSEEAGEPASCRHLTRAACLFAVAVVVHNSDHLRRGVDTVGRDVFWLGTLGIVVEVGIVFLIFQRNRLAPLAAAAGGTALALGYVLVHFLPHHPWFSDSFVSERGISALSWFAASFEVGAAVLLAIAGGEVIATSGSWRELPEPARRRDLLCTLRHPVVLILGVSQVVALVISFAQVYG